MTIHDSRGAVYLDIQDLNHSELKITGFTIVAKEDFPKFATHSGDLFHFVDEERFRNFKFSRSLTYLGTEGDFHLMRYWSKFVNNSEQIFRFAIRECEISNPRSVTEEFRKHTSSYRRVVLRDSKCTVK